MGLARGITVTCDWVADPKKNEQCAAYKTYNDVAQGVIAKRVFSDVLARQDGWHVPADGLAGKVFCPTHAAILNANREDFNGKATVTD